MGSWNGTCAVSNLHVTAGQKVAVFLLLENNEKKSFCYGNAMYDMCPIPFYGEYNDYGAVENCHGFGMNIVVDAIRDQLYEFGDGPNSCHDLAVNRNNLNIDMLFEADHEDRLGIQQAQRHSNDAYDLRELEKHRLESGLTDSQQFELDRLANKIKNIDTFRRVTHVIVHGDIFDDIMTKWYIEDYVGEGKGNAGYGNNYVHIYFKDIEDSIPDYIAKKKQHCEEMKAVEDPKLRIALMRLSGSDSWDSPNLATKWLNGFDSGSGVEFGLIRVAEYIREYEGKEDWEGLHSFVKESLTTLWVNSFMSYTRKAWTKQTGLGSQNSELRGYRTLIASMTRILDAEAAEQAEWDREDEDDEPTPEETAEAMEYFLPKGDPK